MLKILMVISAVSVAIVPSASFAGEITPGSRAEFVVHPLSVDPIKGCTFQFSTGSSKKRTMRLPIGGKTSTVIGVNFEKRVECVLEGLKIVFGPKRK